MKSPVKMFTGLCVLVGSILLVGCLLVAPQASAQPKTLHDGVFTTEQANAGQAVYDRSCKNCHDMKFYENTLKSWNRQPLLYLWEAIMGTMPADNPGSMLFEEYTNVLAYILSENGFPAGEVMLDPDHGMDQINIVSP
ncbi:MAG: hypothetical protein WD772_10670 [Pseudohongiellaceae bacterium]